VLVDATEVDTVKVVELAPAGTVTIAGTVAEGELLARRTGQPPTGAEAEMVTVPVAELPLITELGLNVTEVTCGERTCRSVESPTPSADAPITTASLAATELVPITKLALSAPPGTVTVAGRCTMLELLSEILTDNPAEGATPFRLTVAVVDSPPRTELGASVTSASVAGVIERVAFFEVVPNLAVILAEVFPDTP
jgi:hypothetical protein